MWFLKKSRVLRDIVVLHLRSPANAVKLCVDETTSQIRALARTHPVLLAGSWFPFKAVRRL
jgi:hypothetical protein